MSSKLTMNIKIKEMQQFWSVYSYFSKEYI